MKRLLTLTISTLFLFQTSYATDISTLAQRFLEVLHYIDKMYVDTANTDQLTNTAIKKMLADLDPHSQYIEAKDVEESNQFIKGNFEGIGISYNLIHDTLTVIQAVPGGPSEKVGIFPGDKIVSVDGISICGKNAKTSKIQKLLRGEKGTKVEVELFRRGIKDAIKFTITRDIIPIHSVDASYMIRPNIGYIKLNSFSHTTSEEINTAISTLKTQGMTHLILDLQNNGGGLMQASIELVDHFLDANKLIVYTEGEHQRRAEAKSTSRGLFEDGNITILINEYSASASEITSGAIQDWDRGTIIGRRSYGKGLVQRPIKLSDGSELRLTTARYYTPSGRNIQRPYGDGMESYYKELERRYEHGEFQHADSISFPDSLKYKTLTKRRTVYGGGGIFPDIFVPLDTTEYTKYYRSIVSKGIILTLTAEYLDKNRDEIKKQYPDFNDYHTQFQTPEKLMTKIIKEGKKNKVKYNEEEYNRSKSLIKLQMKALIARGIYSQESFYKVINDTDEILQKALEIILSEQNKQQ